MGQHSGSVSILQQAFRRCNYHPTQHSGSVSIGQQAFRGCNYPPPQHSGSVSILSQTFRRCNYRPTQHSGRCNYPPHTAFRRCNYPPTQHSEKAQGKNNALSKGEPLLNASTAAIVPFHPSVTSTSPFLKSIP